MDAGRSFDESARGAELRLAELRRLLSGSIELTPEQEAALAALTETLAGVEQGALALRVAYEIRAAKLSACTAIFSKRLLPFSLCP